ncbi:MAG: hypothetical protein Q7S81_02220 [bacterium]|nr:hypothetical protein [bacterium]
MKGQITLEILISLFILVASISAAVMVSFGNQSTTVDTQLSNQALYIARQEMETARGVSRQDFNSIAPSSSTEGIYLKEILVENIDAYTKKVTSRVSWKTEVLRPQKIELTTLLTNAKSVVAYGGDTGGVGLSGDWKNPRTLGSVDLGAGISATDLDVLNKIIYLSGDASDSKKKDFFIVNATDGVNPFIASSLNVGLGLNTLDVAGSYVYAGSKDVDAQLQIIDVNDKNNPILKTSYKLPGVSGTGAVGQSIFFFDSKIYIGTKKAGGPEFHIIDVSNPLNPISLGSREFDSDVNAIYVSGDIVYVATSADNKELSILNVANPANIILLGGYDAPGNTEDGKSVALVGSKLYLGRTMGGNNTNYHELHILDVSDSASLQNLGSKDLTVDLNDSRIRGNLAFLATSDSNKEFQIWDISNPNNISLYAFFNFSQIGTGIDYEDNIVYVSVRSNDALRIITSTP